MYLCVKPEASWSERWSNQKAQYTIMLYGCGGTDIDYILESALYYICKELDNPCNDSLMELYWLDE